MSTPSKILRAEGQNKSNFRLYYTSSRPHTQWPPPSESWYKINTDGAFDIKTQTGNGGVIIRDHRGEVLAAEARYYGYISDSLSAEALATRDGLFLAQTIGCDSGFGA